MLLLRRGKLFEVERVIHFSVEAVVLCIGASNLDADNLVNKRPGRHVWHAYRKVGPRFFKIPSEVVGAISAPVNTVDTAAASCYCRKTKYSIYGSETINKGGGEIKLNPAFPVAGFFALSGFSVWGLPLGCKP